MWKICSETDTNDITMITLIKSLWVHKSVRYHKAIVVTTERPQSHCGNNRESPLISWLHNFHNIYIHLICVNSVRIRSFSGSYFPAFGLNTGEIQRYSVQRRDNTDQKPEFSGLVFKSHSDQLSIATSKNPSVVNTICISSFRYAHVIT